jgi:hypothetical protein
LGEKLACRTKKGSAEFESAITPAFIKYCLRDVQLKWEIFEKLCELYERHGFDTPIRFIPTLRWARLY